MSDLTAMELTALEEQLMFEQMVIKKYAAAAQSCADPVLRPQLERIASLHQNHYNKLVNHLK